MYTSNCSNLKENLKLKLKNLMPKRQRKLLISINLNKYDLYLLKFNKLKLK